MVLQTGKHRECCAGPPGAFARPSVPVSLSESAKAHAAVLGSAPGVGRHFILGVAGITFANPGTVTVSLAVAHGNVAAVVPDSPANQGHRPAIQTTVWGMKDREIIAAIVAGDPAGLAGVYDKYAESLYGYCRWMLGGPDCPPTPSRTRSSSPPPASAAPPILSGCGPGFTRWPATNATVGCPRGSGPR